MEELAGRSEDDQWRRLLEWASGYNGFECNVEWKPVPGAGRGLVVDSSGPKPDLLVIPPEMLINPLTLASSPDNIIPLHLFPVQHLDDGHPRKRRKTNRYVSSSTYSSILTGASEKRAETVDKVESKPLNTTQLLTLFLAVNRGSKPKRPSKWSRYLDTLPETFRPWHPLTWLVPETPSKDKAATSSSAGETGIEDGDDTVATLSKLVELAPREPRRKILGVKARYDADLVVLREILKVEEPFKSAHNERITDEDLLWAWLNVNTRSVSIPLGFDGPTELFNHSLVPVLDLINHSSDPDVCVPKPELDTISKSSGPKLRLKPTPWNPTPHLIPGKIGLKIHSRPGGMEVGEELRFQYHAQPTSEMWAEYGFIELPSTSGSSKLKQDAGEAPLEPNTDNRDQKGSRKKRKVESESGVVAEVVEAVGGAKSGRIRWNDLHHGSIDVEDALLEMWEEVDHRTEKQDALKAINCHTNIRIESHPSPHPSRSLVMSLRVLNLPQEQIGRLVGIAQGAIEYISPENEAAVEEDLERLCHRLVNQAEQAVADIDALEEDCKGSAEEAFTATRLLWEEVYSLASDCRMSHRV